MSLLRRLDAYEADRLALLRDLAAMGDDRLRVKPSPDSWSLLEIVEHLALAERVVYRGLPSYTALVHEPRRVSHRVRAVIVRGVLQFGIRVGIPAEAMRPGTATSLDAVRERWDENQRWLRGYIASSDVAQLRRRVFTHPIAGPLSVHDVIPLGHAHLRTHQRQIERVRVRLG